MTNLFFRWTRTSPNITMHTFRLCSTFTKRTIMNRPVEKLPTLMSTILRTRLADHILSQSTDSSLDTQHMDPLPMRVSFDRVLLPLGSQPDLRNTYVTPTHDHVRFGKLLEELDTFAVWLAYRHNQGAPIGLSPRPAHSAMALFTALVDRIDLTGAPIHVDKDIILEGHVSWVGSTSIEVTILLRQAPHFETLLTAKFLMVAKHPVTAASVPVRPLVSESPMDEDLIRHGDDRKRMRQIEKTQSLFKVIPTKNEQEELHRLFLQTIDQRSATFSHRQLPPGAVWMEDARLKNLLICFPEQRNLYGKIFGGYLMRTAFELAWANASVYSRSRPKVLAVDDIIFKRPVPVGSLLYLSSDICFTHTAHMQVNVHAQIVDPDTGARSMSNTFQFTFATRDNCDVPSVRPRTYADGMLYLSGRRHFTEAMKHRQTVL